MTQSRKTKKQPANLHFLSSTDLQRNFGDTIRRVYNNKEHLVIERAGLPVAVMLPMSEYEALTKNRS